MEKYYGISFDAKRRIEEIRRETSELRSLEEDMFQELQLLENKGLSVEIHCFRFEKREDEIVPVRYHPGN